MPNGLSKGLLQRALLSLALTLSLMTAPIAMTVSAAACVPVKAKGKTIATITAGAVKMPIKAFNYPAGGVMEPQGTTLAAGLSKRHMPLNSTLGTSVLTWHVNYKGCWNALNIFMTQKVGFTFKVKDEDGKVTKYRVDRKLTVKKGNYKKSWFTLVGPRQLALFTCTGEFKNGHYTKNMVFIATPV